MIGNARGTSTYHSTERVMIARLVRAPTAHENRSVIEMWLELGFDGLKQESQHS
jgi:hypothetical protein